MKPELDILTYLFTHNRLLKAHTKLPEPPSLSFSDKQGTFFGDIQVVYTFFSVL